MEALERLGFTGFVSNKSFLPFVFGGPGVIRTRDLLIRSQTLYPAELRSHDLTKDIIYCMIFFVNLIYRDFVKKLLDLCINFLLTLRNKMIIIIS